MTTQADPTLDRIRRARREISAECGHDPYALVEYYIELQKRHADRLTSDANPVVHEKSAA
jgi:hypothetical protein